MKNYLLDTMEQDRTQLAEDEAVLNRVQSLPVALRHWLFNKTGVGCHSLMYHPKSRSADIQLNCVYEACSSLQLYDVALTWQDVSHLLDRHQDPLVRSVHHSLELLPPVSCTSLRGNPKYSLRRCFCLLVPSGSEEIAC
jgi:hypothetical protein